jgi:hypothetical protein
VPETLGDLLTAFQAWLRAQTTARTIAIVGHGGALPDSSVSLVLLGIERSGDRRSDGNVRSLDAAVLIAITGGDAADAATASGEVMFALYDERWTDAAGIGRPLHLDDRVAASEARVALELPPCHAILVRLPLHRERQRPSVRPVREPMRLSTEQMSVLEGVVVGEISGSQPQPLVDASIGVPGSGRVTSTDERGRFRLSGLPAHGAVTLVVSAKGRSHSISVEARTGVVVRVPIDDAVEQRCRRLI